MVEFYTEPGDVLPFVEEVIKEADLEKDALGFLRDGVYRELAAQGKLIVAAVGQQYVGHLLFGGVAPHARVFQTHVQKRFRRRGIGRLLVEKLVKNAEGWNYISITARVASDLDANAFYQSMGFRHVRTASGGVTRNRVINVRVRELNTPNLFNTPIFHGSADLGLIEHLPTRAPQYVIDLNVMFDVVRRRVKADDAGRIMTAGFNNLVRLAVTGEFIKELQRSSQSPDPVLEFATRLPVLSQPVPEEISRIVSALERQVFPQRVLEGRLTVQDRSDLIHLATAIFHRAAGFITGEKAILGAREFLRERYGLDVVSVGEMAALADSTTGADASSIAVTYQNVEIESRTPKIEDLTKISALLERLGVARPFIDELSNSITSSGAEQVLILANDQPIVFGTWVTESHESVQAFVCADEDNPSIETALDRALDNICRASCRNNPSMVRLRVITGHAKTRSVAMLHGFRPSADQPHNASVFHKVCVGKCVTKETWPSIRNSLRRAAGLILPECIPKFQSYADMIQVTAPTGNLVFVSLEDLETLLSPILLLLPGRTGAIVPIRPRFASDLFGKSPQLRLLYPPEAGFLRERIYFSDPKTCPLLQRGKLVLFYESGKERGRSSIIAAARVVRTDLVPKAGVLTELLRRGVLPEKTLKRMGRSAFSAATIFDNILHFRNPVSLKRMQALGFKDPANLITTTSVADEVLGLIVHEGKPIV
jgi:GNAT superfamily N-acetyltransferase